MIVFLKIFCHCIEMITNERKWVWISKKSLMTHYSTLSPCHNKGNGTEEWKRKYEHDSVLKFNEILI